MRQPFRRFSVLAVLQTRGIQRLLQQLHEVLMSRRSEINDIRTDGLPAAKVPQSLEEALEGLLVTESIVLLLM